MWSNAGYADTGIKAAVKNAEASFIFQMFFLWRTAAPWRTTKSSHRASVCAADLQGYDVEKAASEPGHVRLYFSWHVNSNPLCRLVYLLFPLLLSDACQSQLSIMMLFLYQITHENQTDHMDMTELPEMTEAILTFLFGSCPIH